MADPGRRVVDHRPVRHGACDGAVGPTHIDLRDAARCQIPGRRGVHLSTCGILELFVAIRVVAGRPFDRSCFGRLHGGREHGAGIRCDRHRAFGHAGRENRHEHEEVARKRFHVLVDRVDP